MNSLAEIKGKADGMLVTAILFIVLAGVAVGLRIFTRAVVKMRFGLDDWAIISALLLFYIVEGLEIYCVSQARNATNALDPKFETFMYYDYIDGTLYYLTIMMTNISILCLYRRIFATKAFRRISLIMIFVNIAWCIPGTVVEIFICNPINGAWDFTVDGNCIQYGTFWIIILTAELLIDVTILVLPIREIANLQICWNQKLLVSMMFLLGGLVIITGIVRMPLSYNPNTPAVIDLPEDALWLNVHLGSAIICACLPTYRPLFRKDSSFWGIFRHSRDISLKEPEDLHQLSWKTNSNDGQAPFRNIEGQEN